MTIPPLLDEKQIADLIGGVSPNWVIRNVPYARRFGRAYRWSRADLHRWIDTCRENPREVSQRRRESTSTYFFYSPTNGLIKIGRSVNPERRRQTLETQGGVKIAILAIIDADVERDWHLEYDHLRVIGEWFEPAPDLVEAISDLDWFPA